MYTLYTDKSELFEATISVSGASLSDTTCRLLIESDVISLVFSGKVDSDGRVEIPIRSLAKFFPEGSEGNMKLEVIAENTYFVPWESEFTVKTKKKVTAEVVRHDSPVLVEAKPKTAPKSSAVIHSDNIAKLIKSSKTPTELKSTVTTYMKEHKVNDSDIDSIRNRIKQELKHAFKTLKAPKKSR
jgi:serine kinase of HPr protein (carbohydrate metabolism regulator)